MRARSGVERDVRGGRRHRGDLRGRHSPVDTPTKHAVPFDALGARVEDEPCRKRDDLAQHVA
jgi:hypothetical protein